MTTWFTSMLDENAVYWSPPIRDGFGGYSWEYPIEIKSRWRIDSTVVYATDGSQVAARSSVWVDHDVLIGGYMWKGTIEDLATIFDPAPPFSVEDLTTEQIYSIAAQIVSLSKVRSIPSKTTKLTKAFLI